MSSGIKHENFSTVVIITTYILSIYYLVDYKIASTIIHLSALFQTFFLNNDTDLMRTRPIKNWGVWKFLILPYTLLSKHRGTNIKNPRQTSHIFVVGDVIRFIYINIAISIFILSIYLFVYCIFTNFEISDLVKAFILLWKILVGLWSFINPYYFFYIIGSIVAGLCYGGMLHLIKDRKKKRRKK